MSDQNAAEALAGLIQWLRERHDRIMTVEAEALRLLESGDTPGHNAKMREKAEMLAALGEDAKPLLAGLPGELSFNLALALERFSGSARNALGLNSVFYMSALLYPEDFARIRAVVYPEDHKQGEPDDLTVCIDRMEREGENFS